MGRIAARVLAGVLAVASAAPIVMALFLTLLSVAVSAQQPDPTIPDGDPCCGHPDTWGAVALGFVSAAMFLLGACAVALPRSPARALRSVWPRSDQSPVAARSDRCCVYRDCARTHGDRVRVVLSASALAWNHAERRSSAIATAASNEGGSRAIGLKSLSYGAAGALELPPVVQFDLRGDLLGAGRELGECSMCTVAGIEDGERQLEDVHVEVPWVVLPARLQGCDRGGERAAVEDGGQVASLGNGFDGCPVEGFLHDCGGVLDRQAARCWPDAV